MQLAPGDVFAGYRVVRQIGTGGMGAVFLVDHPRLPRRDALKLLNRELATDPDFVARFMREADIVSGLSHRNIVSIYDRGEEAGQLWLTMRYVDGIDAEAALEQAGGLLPAQRAVHIVSEVAGALDAAHRRNLVHRDVKPANVLLCLGDDDEPEQVFLTDFGIAKSLDAGSRLTATGLVVATFDYASPEQIEAQTLDARSDVYSLGCLLYKLLTGSVPFPGETLLAPAAGHLGLPPPRATSLAPWLAPALDDVIARAMSKDPAERYPTCRALATAAARSMDDFPEPPGPPYRVFLSRPGNGPVGAALGPVGTDGLSEQDAARLVALVRRTRFFDLPERLAGASSGQRQVTLEIGCTGRIHRVVADLDSARRPPELEDLVATVEQLRTGVHGQARTASPTQRHVLPPPPRDVPAAVASAPSAAPPSRFSQPPPPVSAPFPAIGRQATAARPDEGVAPRSGPLPQLQVRSGPPTSPPVQAPATPPPDFPWTPQPPSGPGRAPRPPRRRRTALIALLLAIVVGGGAAAWFVIDRNRDDVEDGGSGSSSASQTTEPTPTDPPTAEADRALAALPRAPEGLGEQTLVVAREVEGNVDLYVVEANGTIGARLTTTPEEDQWPSISPDRRTVIYVHETPTGVELRTVAVNGHADRPLFEPPLPDCTVPSRPAWNPTDATQLALTCTAAPVAAVRVVSLDGVTLRELEPALPNIGDLAFSPDGRQLAYWGDDEPGKRAGHLFIQANDDSGEWLSVTTSGTDNGPAWSPDGRTLAYSHGDGQGTREIAILDLEDPDADPETLVPSQDDWNDAAPAWSTDGESIAFRSHRDASDQIWVVDVDSRELTQVTDSGRAVSAPAWGYR